MKRIIFFLSITLLILLVISLTVQSQPLVNRSRIEIRGGMMRHGFDASTRIGISGIEVSTGASGFMASIGYSKWIQENLALTFSISPVLVDNDVTVGISGVSTGTNAITPIFIGARYYLFESTYGKSMRPYLSAAAGPVVGSASETSVGLTVEVSSHTETAFGAKFGLGVDFLLFRSFIIGFDSGYNAITNFSQPIGSEDNYSGADFSIGFSFLFGGGGE